MFLRIGARSISTNLKHLQRKELRILSANFSNNTFSSTNNTRTRSSTTTSTVTAAATTAAALVGLSLLGSSTLYAEAPSSEVAESSELPELTPQVNSDGLTIDSDDQAHLVNWSRTHEAQPKRLYIPENVEELMDLVKFAHKTGRKLRPCGTYLSPNGLATGEDMMVSLAGLDRIKNINLEKQEVTVEAGIVVDELLKELSKVGLTLANFSSIKEQQMGGWTQVAAHGTGATLPTVDEMITSMKICTPGQGMIELSNEKNPTLFKLARVGLGCLGIVTELTLSCVPVHKLHEYTYVVHSIDEVRKNHTNLLNEYRHVRYMWIPGTDDCVVVVSNPIDSDSSNIINESAPVDLTKSLRTLLIEKKQNVTVSENASFADLRDQLLACDPLNIEWVKTVNRAESIFWKNASGERIDWSEEILGFECGGSQWVFEVCFPTGTLEKPNGCDLDFVEELKIELEAAGLPAPSPIEQRWTASSTSPMSPAYSQNSNDIYSWVGGIMYMPNDESRASVTEKFREYMKVMNKLSERYDAHAHWAKIELPKEDDVEYFSKLMKMKRRLKEKYPVDEFNSARQQLDPKGILSNDMVNILFGK